MENIKRICHECKSQMTSDCRLDAYLTEGVILVKKEKGFFNKKTSKINVAVCPNCGKISLYAEDYKKFK